MHFFCEFKISFYICGDFTSYHNKAKCRRLKRLNLRVLRGDFLWI